MSWKVEPQRYWWRTMTGHGPNEDIVTQVRAVYQEQGAHLEERRKVLQLLQNTSLILRQRIISEIVHLGSFVRHCSIQELDQLCTLCNIDIAANSFELLFGCAMRFRSSWQRFNKFTQEVKPEHPRTVAALVDFLLRRGADINATNSEGLTVVEKAAESRCGLNGLDILISRGAKGLTDNIALDPLKSAALRGHMRGMMDQLVKPNVTSEQCAEALELFWAVQRKRERGTQRMSSNEVLLKALDVRERRKVPHKHWVTSCPFLGDATVLNSFNDLYKLSTFEGNDRRVLSAILIIEKAFGSIDAIDIEVGVSIMQLVVSYCSSSSLLARIIRTLCVKPNFPLMLGVPVMATRKNDLTFREFAQTCAALCRVEVPRAWHSDLVQQVQFLLNSVNSTPLPEDEVRTLRSNEERTAALYAVVSLMDQGSRWRINTFRGERLMLALVRDGACVGSRGWSGRGVDHISTISMVMGSSSYSSEVQSAFQESIGCCTLMKKSSTVVKVDPLRCIAAKVLRHCPAELTEDYDDCILRGGIILRDYIDIHMTTSNRSIIWRS